MKRCVPPFYSGQGARAGRASNVTTPSYQNFSINFASIKVPVLMYSTY